MRIACVLGSDYEDSEFRVPYDRLRGQGHEVTVIGLKAGETLKGKKGKDQVRAEQGIDGVDAEDFDALFIPGGYSPDQLRADQRMVDFARQFRDKPILAICHGPQLLLTADMVRGRRLTAWRTVQGDLRFAGADVVDEEVVVDRNLVTSRQPQDLDAFVREASSLLQSGVQPGAAP
jgi:protease I